MLRALSKAQDNFALHFAGLFAAILAFTASRPPYANEWIYLLRLVRTYDKEYLLNDFSFSVPASEHWLFNHTVGLFTFFLSIETIAWIGRLGCWTLLLYAVMRLARHWDIPQWITSIGIFLWLCVGQSVVAHEWIIGTFEAKNLAYICLLFALDGFARGRAAYPAILLGLTFSFHPAVGLWSLAACAAGLAFSGLSRTGYFRIFVLTVLFALPGLLPLVGDIAAPASADDWRFVELVGMPQLLDPFAWSKSAIILVYLQLAFCIAIYRRGERSTARRFLTVFIIALGVFFTLGFVLRAFEQYELLRSMPTRLLPVFIPLFFFWSLGDAYKQGLLAPPVRGAAILAFVCVLLWPNPVSTAANLVRQTYESWSVPTDGTARAYEWIGQNTPNGTIVIAPPWRQDFWYRSGRAQVASSGFPTYMSLGEWRKRIIALTGESVSTSRTSENDERPSFYNSLPIEQLNAIARETGAEYLVTDGEYPFAKVFESGGTRVYKLGVLPVKIPE